MCVVTDDDNRVVLVVQVKVVCQWVVMSGWVGVLPPILVRVLKAFSV